MTYAGLTAYAFAPEGGFSAGGCTTGIRACDQGKVLLRYHRRLDQRHSKNVLPCTLARPVTHT